MKDLLTSTMVSLVLALGGWGCGDDDDDGQQPTVDAAATIDAAGGGIDAAAGTPTASFTMDPDCTMSSSTEITFTSTSTDPEQQTLTCAWVFQSGTPSTADTCTVTGVTFPHVQPYDVTLTVTDPDDNTDSALMPIGLCQ